MLQKSWILNIIAGLCVTAALVGLLLLLSRVSSVSFVPLDISDAIIRLTPGAIATQGIETLGPGAKVGIELAGSAIFILFGALLGWLYGRIAPRRMIVVVVVLAIVALVLTLIVQTLGGGMQTGATGLLLLTVLYLLWGTGLAWMVNRLVVPGVTATTPAATPTAQLSERRAFLTHSGGTLLAIAVGSTAIAQLLESNGVVPSVTGAGAALPTSPPTAPGGVAAIAPTSANMAEASTVVAQPTSAPALTAPTSANMVEASTAVAQLTSAPAPTAIPAFIPAPGTRSPFNTNETLYVISSDTRDPQVARDDWRLEIGGAVDRPFSLSYAELTALPRVDQTSTLECISNEVGNYLIGNPKWNGVLLKDLLERAGLQDGIVDIKLTAAEGYTESIPLAKAMEPTTLIAYGIDGQALAVKHGFPARLRVPGLYGEKNVKWLTKIEAVREDYQGYWQQRGWTDKAVIETTAVFDTGNPRLSKDPLKRENGIVPLGGIAFAGNRGIDKVEVRIDDGEWQAAVLDPVNDPLTWRFWRYDWQAQPGKYILTVRAVDSTGQMQTEQMRDPHPEGSTGYHIIPIEVS